VHREVRQAIRAEACQSGVGHCRQRLCN
jgi:hypothetical protein